MSGFYTDPNVIDAYAEEILKESEKKPIVESASTFNEEKKQEEVGAMLGLTFFWWRQQFPYYGLMLLK